MDYRQLYPDLMRKYNLMSFGNRGEARALPENTGIFGDVENWVNDPQKPERQFVFGGIGNWAGMIDKGQEPSYIDRAMASLDMLPGVDDIAAKGLLGVATAAGPAWMGKRMAQGGVPSGGALGRQRGIIGGENSLAGDYAPTESGIFGPEHAAIDRKEMLGLAKEMEKKLPPEKLYDATGWWRGQDGKWRSELDDSQAVFPHSGKINENKVGLFNPQERKSYFPGQDFPIPPAIADENLAGAFAEIGDMPVKLTHNLHPSLSGRYVPNPGRIEASIRSADRPDLDTTLLHEAQHAVQDLEGFSAGASPESATKALTDAHFNQANYRQNVMNSEGYKKAIDAITMNRERMEQQIKEGLITNDDYYRMDDQFHEAIGKQYPEFAIVNAPSNLPHISPDPHANYQKVAGEVEARNVERRHMMTPDDRRMLAPWKTEDVPPELQFGMSQRGGLYSPDTAGGIYAEALKNMGML